MGAELVFLIGIFSSGNAFFPKRKEKVLTTGENSARIQKIESLDRGAVRISTLPHRPGSRGNGKGNTAEAVKMPESLPLGRQRRSAGLSQKLL